MNETETGSVRETGKKLLEEYVSLCNRAIDQNQDKFWYQRAKRLNQALWRGGNFLTRVYDRDPNDPLGEYTLHFDADSLRLRLLPPGEHDVVFSWNASLAYLRDVVLERPEWYLKHPIRLDWVWMKARAKDELVHHVDGRSVAMGFALGALAGVLTGAALARACGGSSLQHR